MVSYDLGNCLVSCIRSATIKARKAWQIRLPRGPSRWVPGTNNTDEMIENAARASLESGMAQPGDLVVITAGQPQYVKGTTDMLRVKRL